MTERIPRRITDSFPADMNLDPFDGFVWERIDGNLTENEIATLTGLAGEDFLACMGRLERAGLVTYSEPPPKAAEEEIELDPSKRALVSALYTKFANTTNYELLGVSVDAEKKDIKRAYFDLAAVVHPDKYFKKRLGPYKAMMEAIFARVTEAHDVLSNPKRRADYDKYLGIVLETMRMEAQLQKGINDAKRAAEEAKAEKAREQAALEKEIADLNAKRADPSPGPAAGATPAATTPKAGAMPPPLPKSSSPSIPRIPSSANVPVADEAARKAALAAKLLAGRKVSQPNVVAAKVEQQKRTLSGEQAVAALKQRYEEKQQHMHEARIRGTRAAIDNAKAAGDWASAANALRMAISHYPDDPSFKDELQVVEKKATEQLADQYWKQGLYEREQGNWQGAEKSFRRVTEARPLDAVALEAAAAAILKANGNLHEAADFAKRAVELSPKNAAYQTTLGHIYLQAQQLPAAKSALKRALELDAGLDLARGLLAKAEGKAEKAE